MIISPGVLNGLEELVTALSDAASRPIGDSPTYHVEGMIGDQTVQSVNKFGPDEYFKRLFSVRLGMALLWVRYRESRFRYRDMCDIKACLKKTTSVLHDLLSPVGRLDFQKHTAYRDELISRAYFYRAGCRVLQNLAESGNQAMPIIPRWTSLKHGWDHIVQDDVDEAVRYDHSLAGLLDNRSRFSWRRRGVMAVAGAIAGPMMGPILYTLHSGLVRDHLQGAFIMGIAGSIAGFFFASDGTLTSELEAKRWGKWGLVAGLVAGYFMMPYELLENSVLRSSYLSTVGLSSVSGFLAGGLLGLIPLQHCPVFPPVRRPYLDP